MTVCLITEVSAICPSMSHHLLLCGQSVKNFAKTPTLANILSLELGSLDVVTMTFGSSTPAHLYSSSMCELTPVCVCMTNTNLNKIIHKSVKWNVKVQSHFDRIRKHQPSAPVSSYSSSFWSCSASLRTSVGRTRFSAETQDLVLNHLSP